MDINKSIGIVIASHRKSLGLEQEWFAERLKVSQPVVSRLENGNAQWTVERFLRACSELNIDHFMMMKWSIQHARQAYYGVDYDKR